MAATLLENIVDTTGNTPLVRLRRALPAGLPAEILLKLEYL
jgi:cysteine synthase